MKNAHKIFSNFIFLFAIFIFISTIYFVAKSKINHEDIFFYGYKPYIIQTGSMEPALKVGSLIIIKKGDFKNVKANDIISFVLPGTKTYICHRAIRLEEDKIVTKGDNNKIEDIERVTNENYIGKLVFKTNITSFILNQFKSTIGIIKMVVAIIVIILIIVSIKLLQTNVTRKKPKH